jgi:hypothetical protein
MNDLAQVPDDVLAPRITATSPRWPFEGWSPYELWRDGRLYALQHEAQWVVINNEPSSDSHDERHEHDR